MYGLDTEDIEAINKVFSKHPEIETAVLYGSRAKGNYRNDSDIDLTLKGEQITLSQLFEIETELDDLLLPYKIDLSIYHKIENPDFIEHIDRVGIIFYKNETNKWKETILDNHIDLISGYAFKSKDFIENQEEGTLPIIKIKNVANGDVNLKDVVYHNYEESLSKYLLSKGDVLIAMTGNHPQAKTQVVGDVSRYKLDVNALLNQRVGKIVPKGKTDLDFLYYFFKDKDTHRYLANQSSGSANQANISKTTIVNLETEFPEPVEQKSIAKILKSLDDKIDLLQSQNKTLEAMAETLFRQWFVEEVDLNWEEKPLSGIATFLNGLACQKFPPKNEIDKLPVLKIKQLRNGFSNDSDWCTTEVKPEYIVQNGDVIFSWSASLMIKIWDGETAILNQHLFKVSSDVYPKWFYYLWSKFHLQEFISISESHATTMGHIKRSDLDNAIVLVPDDKKMIEFTEIQEPIIDKIIYNSQQLSKLIELRDTLLPNLMSGEIKVMADD